MIVANNKSGIKIRPIKNTDAFCPSCGHNVISKMGKLRMHHWAHREKSDCSHGIGMTEWHYRWIERHFEKDGWDVEYIDGNRRYDCFNQQKSLAVEIQTVPLYDYILDKTSYIITRNLKVKWILHSDIFRKL